MCRKCIYEIWETRCARGHIVLKHILRPFSIKLNNVVCDVEAICEMFRDNSESPQKMFPTDTTTFSINCWSFEPNWLLYPKICNCGQWEKTYWKVIRKLNMLLYREKSMNNGAGPLQRPQIFSTYFEILWNFKIIYIWQ